MLAVRFDVDVLAPCGESCCRIEEEWSCCDEEGAITGDETWKNGWGGFVAVIRGTLAEPRKAACCRAREYEDERAESDVGDERRLLDALEEECDTSDEEPEFCWELPACEDCR